MHTQHKSPGQMSRAPIPTGSPTHLGPNPAHLMRCDMARLGTGPYNFGDGIAVS